MRTVELSMIRTGASDRPSSLLNTTEDCDREIQTETEPSALPYSSLGAKGVSRIMNQRTLEDLIRTAGTPVKLLRNSQIGPYAFPVVRSEFSNWRDEQRAWKET